MRLLLVEDDPAVAAAIVETLELRGFDTCHVTSGAAALHEVEHGAPACDLVLLDLGLPDMDGLDVCREVRRRRRLPVIIVSGRGDEIDRVMGLELGADDYVVKPFGMSELIARIRAVLRRHGTDAGDGTERPQGLRVGDLTIDRRSRRAFLADVELTLTPKEYQLLVYLATEPDAVRARQDIVEAVWDANWYGPTKTVDVHVASLRKKLGDGRWIETVRGIGFRLAPPR